MNKLLLLVSLLFIQITLKNIERNIKATIEQGQKSLILEKTN